MVVMHVIFSGHSEKKKTSVEKGFLIWALLHISFKYIFITMSTSMGVLHPVRIMY